MMTTTTPAPVSDELLQQRRIAVSHSQTITGLDYVNVDSTTPALNLYFVAKTSPGVDAIPAGITADNIQITIKGKATDFQISSIAPPNGNILTVHFTSPSFNKFDNTVYTLSLIQSISDNDTNPFPNVDIFLYQADFAIASNSQTSIDGLQTTIAATAPAIAPEIDYLSRDYLSFRQLMLSRLSALIPDWQADNEADLGSVVIEILAYAADYLSYYQDAVSTEAYLGTARSRISVKRHARLLDYILSEGCNARVWAHIEVSSLLPLTQQTLLLSRGLITPGAVALNTLAYDTLISDANVISFATLYDITLYPAHNQINFYTWGSQQFSLAAGATSASLLGDFSATLNPGDVLVFAQVKGTDTGTPEDADSTLRWAVRLETILPDNDPLFLDASGNPTRVTEITWNNQDALPFEVVIASIINGSPVPNISLAYGNMVLADQGKFIINETLKPNIVPDQGIYYPTLSQPNITFWQPFDNNVAIQQGLGANQVMRQDPRSTVPYISLKDSLEQNWNIQQDLLNSNYLSTDFVVEIEDSRKTFIRFGDGVFGKPPSPGSAFTANYRISNGSAGNIGADALAYIVVDATLTTSIISVSNPLPAQGGANPESIAQVKIYAPEAFQQQERCVTVNDYIQRTKQYTYVDQATGENDSINSVNAVLRWTGSWNTVFIAPALKGGANFDDNFKQGLLNYLDRYKLMHHDLEIIQPKWVALTISLPVTVAPGYSPNIVQQSLVQTFSSNSPEGFFYPDNFVFGQPVYLSDIVVAAMKIPGVASVDITPGNATFQRVGEDPAVTLAAQKITIGPLEIARVNSNIPGQGSIQFVISS